MRAVLSWEEGGVPRRHEFARAAVVGREAGCDVVLDSPKVSRRHAVLEPGEDGWVLRDLGSGNGTTVDGEPVETAALHTGETIRLGDVALIFETLKDDPLSGTKKLSRTLTQSLKVKPVRRARKVAAVVATVLGILLLLGAALWERQRARTGAVAPRPAPARPAAR